MNAIVTKLVSSPLASLARSQIITRCLSCATNGMITHGNMKMVPSLTIFAEKNAIKINSNSYLPKIKDSAVKSSIIDPVVSPRGDIVTPHNLNIQNFQLPTLNKNELFDPIQTQIEEKKTLNMLRIRKKKMKKHKYQKLQKKMGIVFLKYKMRRKKKRDAIFMEGIQKILAQGEAYNAEAELQEKLSILNKEMPINKVHGYFAPKEVVEQYLESEREKKVEAERVAYCLNKLGGI